MSEGYRNCKPQDVPPGTEFGPPERVGKVRVSFGDWGGAPKRWGAPYRCLVYADGKVQYARYFNDSAEPSEI